MFKLKKLKKGSMIRVKKVLGVALMAAIAINLFTHGRIITLDAYGGIFMGLGLVTGIFLLRSGSQA